MPRKQPHAHRHQNPPAVAQPRPTVERPYVTALVLFNTLPAIIQHVAGDDSVRLFVFGAERAQIEEGVKFGDGARQWSWPPRT